MGTPQMSNDDGLPSKVGNCKACFLCVLAIPEYDLDFLCDGSILIWSSINIVDWYWVWQGVSLQLVLLGKAQLTNIPVTLESRRVEVEMQCREVVVRSSMLMLRVQADLDRMYMDRGVTAGGSGDTDSCFSLGASLLSGVPHIGCDLVGYLQQEHFLLSNQGTLLAGCGSKNPATPLPCFLQARCHQWPLLSWHHL